MATKQIAILNKMMNLFILRGLHKDNNKIMEVIL